MQDLDGYIDADRDCPYCDGSLWKNNHVLVCDTCYGVLGDADRRHIEEPTPWERFDTDRPEYTSRYDRCVGGVVGAYIGTGSYELGDGGFSLK